MKRTMTMEQRKTAGIKAAREKAENDRKMGGRAPPRVKKAENAEGAGAEVNGVKGAKEVGGAKSGKEAGGVKGEKEVNGVVDGKAA